MDRGSTARFEYRSDICLSVTVLEAPRLKRPALRPSFLRGSALLESIIDQYLDSRAAARRERLCDEKSFSIGLWSSIGFARASFSPVRIWIEARFELQMARVSIGLRAAGWKWIPWAREWWKLFNPRSTRSPAYFYATRVFSRQWKSSRSRSLWKGVLVNQRSHYFRSRRDYPDALFF